MGTLLLQPLGLNRCDHSGIGASGFNQFSTHQPARLAFTHDRAGKDPELVAAGTVVLAFFLVLANQAQQPG